MTISKNIVLNIKE